MEVWHSKQQILATAIASLLQETGVESVKYSTIQTLTKMSEAFLTRLGKRAHSYCELAGRTEPLVTDVILALTNMGLTLEGIEGYAYRPYRMIFENPETEKEPTRVSLLHVGHKEKRAPYITKNMPRYPDLHTYRRTPCIKMPVIDKSKLLIKKTEERRCIERAMINLKMKNKLVDTLYFPHHPNLYPLIPCTISVPAYLSALQPSDQSYFNDTENSSDMDEEVDNPYLYPARLSKKETVK